MQFIYYNSQNFITFYDRKDRPQSGSTKKFFLPKNFRFGMSPLVRHATISTLIGQTIQSCRIVTEGGKIFFLQTRNLVAFV